MAKVVTSTPAPKQHPAATMVTGIVSCDRPRIDDGVFRTNVGGASRNPFKAAA